MKNQIQKCKYFGVCGGCKYRDLSYKKQLKQKEKRIKESLRSFAHPVVKPILPSPVIEYYRNKMEYSFGIWDEKLALGLRERKKYYHVIDVKKCFLQSPLSDKIRDTVRKSALTAKIKAYHRNKLTGILRYLVIREGKNTNQCMVHFITSPTPEKKMNPIFKDLQQKYPEITTLIWSVTESTSDVAIGEHMEVIWGPGYIEECIGKLRVKVSPYSFYQANTLGAETLYDVIKKYVKNAPKEILLDIYSGAGCIGLFVADMFKMVIGLEQNHFAVKDAHSNMRSNNIHNYRAICTRAEDIKHQPTTFSFTEVTAVVNPPRPGLGSELLDFLCEKKPAVLLYVSCNPDALERDLQRLTQYYKITNIQPIDLFPHTPHVETVIMLKRRKKV